MAPPTPAPRPFRERLLPTAEDSVDPDVAEAVSRFCASSPEVEAAYICLTERQHEGAEPVHARRLSFKLGDVADEEIDEREAHRRLLERLMSSEAELAEQLGCGVLAEPAVSAWATHGVRFFAR